MDCYQESWHPAKPCTFDKSHAIIDEGTATTIGAGINGIYWYHFVKSQMEGMVAYQKKVFDNFLLT